MQTKAHFVLSKVLLVQVTIWKRFFGFFCRFIGFFWQKQQAKQSISTLIVSA
jgi:hypothetical protein